MPTYKKPKMTNWYDPGQLMDTAKRTVISTTVGQYADPRSGGSAPTPGKFFDYSRFLVRTPHDFDVDSSKGKREEIWIDYAADVGDGFNPTYAVAYYMSQPILPVGDDNLPRGEILFFGGDGVYPTGNAGRYEDKLVTPYRMAFKSAAAAAGPSPLGSELAQHPHIFALPGNHDWYDSLVAFKQLFCSHIFNDRRFAHDRETELGGWSTRQRRSYFTLKLPQNWWLLGVDLQLQHNIDVEQLLYFESIVDKMEPGDKVILCVPEPYWVKYIKYQGVTDKYDAKEKSIEKLDAIFRARGVKVKAFIAGDLHHYRRFEDKDGVQKITAGGGGAFLHPTHDFKFETKQSAAGGHRPAKNYNGFLMAGEYPEYSESKKLDRQNFAFIFRNPKFGALTAIIYFVLALLVHGRVTGKPLIWSDTEFWYRATTTTIDRMIDEPLVIVIVGLLLAALVFFTDSESKRFKRWAGGLHGTANLVGAFVFGWLAYALSVWIGGELKLTVPSTLYNVIWFFTVLFVCGAGGYVVGSLIMGIYLYISLHIFGRHSNETFSALKIEDYKNFLRLHIDKDGLTIYPIKIQTVPKNWQAKDDYFTPADGDAPALIEAEPIVVR
ncbi:MAG TPA: hypothetical protein VMZ26_10065 [Pyrinomonadaceae bacterium]|nr:hypothetical protein [Pyrinomonadaceae bacterium]